MITTFLILILQIQSQSQTSYKEIHEFKDRDGNSIGEIHGEILDDSIYTRLKIIDVDGKELFFFDREKIYKESELDLQVDADSFYGYKIVLLKNDYVVIYYLADGGNSVSDDLTIEYNYRLNAFERVVFP